ncbi:hypothetical protein MTR_6g008020 [Medicago truncatula]|uniref:Uncharacterized protein n=1 Tax=Medicago truncatula TaxID=3880 RepID=G7KIV6_MEDTR|nr:hypothetical protein MTR_6g008020 [Medicago truncatula]
MAQKFWRKVVTATAYILNKCITEKLKLKVPEEEIPDARRMLEDKSESMELIWYHSTGVYMLYIRLVIPLKEIGVETNSCK